MRQQEGQRRPPLQEPTCSAELSTSSFRGCSSSLPDLLQDPSVLILIFGSFLSGCASLQELRLQPPGFPPAASCHHEAASPPRLKSPRFPRAAASSPHPGILPLLPLHDDGLVGRE